MYHIVFCVIRPLNKVLRLSARERDATTPMMIRTTPAINRTTPRTLAMLMVGVYIKCRTESTEPLVLGVNYLTETECPEFELVSRAWLETMTHTRLPARVVHDNPLKRLNPKTLWSFSTFTKNFFLHFFVMYRRPRPKSSSKSVNDYHGYLLSTGWN